MDTEINKVSVYVAQAPGQQRWGSNRLGFPDADFDDINITRTLMQLHGMAVSTGAIRLEHIFLFFCGRHTAARLGIACVIIRPHYHWPTDVIWNVKTGGIALN